MTELSFQNPKDFRTFDDVGSLRDSIFDKSIKAVATKYPLSNEQYSLELADVKYKDNKMFSYDEQKKAIMEGASLNRPINGTWILRDATGNPVDKKRSTVAAVPFLTERGTFIVNGSEYTISNQARLKPGVYTREKDSGELEAHFNIKPGTGPSFKLLMEPGTGVFRMQVGQANLKLYPILKAMGADDKSIQKWWGKELFKANATAEDPRALARAYAKLSRSRAALGVGDPTQVQQTFQEIFDKMELNEDTTRATLGTPYSRVSSDTLMRATQKLVNVSKKTEETDDRDSLSYQSFHTPDDFFEERIKNDAGQIGRKLLWKSTLRGNLKHVPTRALDPQFNSVFITSGLGQCFDKETWVLTSRGFILWEDVRDNDLFACRINDRIEYHKPIKLYQQYYEGSMYKCRTKRFSYLVTPNHRCYTKTKKKAYKFERADKVHSFTRNFSTMLGKLKNIKNPKWFEVYTTENRHNNPIGFTVSIEDWVEFLGWWMAEGSCNWWQGKGSVQYTTRIAQDIKVNPIYCKSIDKLLRRMGITFRYCKQSKSFVIKNKALFVELESYGHGCGVKRIPRYLFELKEDLLRKFFDAYMAGDGNNYKGYLKASTVSRNLAIDLIELFGRLGYTGLMSSRVRNDCKLGYEHTVACGRAIEANIRSTSTAKSSKKPNPYSIINYSGMVYCAEVPGGLLYVMRDGKPHWSGNSLEEINPLQILEQNRRVIRLGEGGIGSIDAIPDSSRSVQPSHLGFLDPTVTPEGTKIGVDSRLTIGAVKGPGNNIYTKLKTPSGRDRYVDAATVSKSILAFPGEMEKGEPVVRAIINSKQISYVPREKVNFAIPDSQHMFTGSANMVPFVSASKGGRLLMGAKMISQALPLRNAESPLVSSVSSDGRSFDEVYGEQAGAVRSPIAGRVTGITKTHVEVKDAKGERHKYQLYHNFPYNRKTFIHNTPAVAMGDMVAPGQLLAKSNYTDNKGITALGKNLRVAYLSHKGQTTDDAIVISESAAKKLSSEHMYTSSVEKAENREIGKHSFISIYPAKYNKTQLKTLDENGVVKPGTVVKYGDPLVLSADKRKAGGWWMLNKTRKPVYSDSSATWNHEAEGLVTDVTMTKDGPNVAVKAYMPMQPGDKMCYDEETEILTLEGWKAFKDLKMDDYVATLNVLGKIEYIQPSKLVNYRHKGRMYSLQSQQLDFTVTDTHKQYVCKRDKKQFELLEVQQIFGKRVKYKKDGEWAGAEVKEVVFPALPVAAGQFGHGERIIPELRLKAETFMMLLGMFLSEGNIINQPKSGNYGLDICQIKSSGVKKLLEAFDLHKVKYNRSGDKFRIHSKQLMLYFRQFGKCFEKYIPNNIFMYSKRLLKILFKWLMWGDGHTKNGKPIYYTTTSKVLADDVQRLCLHIGYAGNIKEKEETEGFIRGKKYKFRKRYDVRIVVTKTTPTVNHGHVHTQKVQNEEWVNYDGIVYCCTVPKNHTLYVRRAGKAAWSGNSGRFGDKGVVSEIIPDDQMMRDSTGQPIDIMVSPLGIISRGNPSQMHEAMLGKIARITGKKYVVPGFMDENIIDFVEQELKKNRISDTESLLDPITGKKIPKVFVGDRYYMKLHHTAETKASERGLGAYTAEDVPAKGSFGKAKRIGLMGTNALLSHGAINVLRDAHAIRGQRNDDYWKLFKMGLTPPAPKSPLMYDKFLSSLTAAGINVKRSPKLLQIMALTDKDIDKLAKGQITKADTVSIKNMEPIEGGLFDRTATGGPEGNRWSYVKLTEPMPNPVMETPIKKLLNLTQSKFEDIVSGKEKLHGKTGGSAIKEALRRMNVDTEIDRNKGIIKSGPRSKRDSAIKALGYLEMLKKTNIKPEELVLSKVPVLPPSFRPVSAIDGMQLVSDSNYLYQDLITVNKDLAELKKEAPEEMIHDDRLRLYNSFKAVTGLGDSVNPKYREKRVKGVLAKVLGKSPKVGSFQQKLLGATVDITGRSVITPNSTLNMDQVGLPEDQAWEIYEPFIVRDMVRKGMQPTDAVKSVAAKSAPAKNSLLQVIKTRPMIINRAPTLHKYGLMAAWPVLHKGKTLQISPIVAGGFGADFDGDAMNYHVPVDNDAVKDAIDKMLPSRNLLSTADFKVHYIPKYEFLQGLSIASGKKNKKEPRVFGSTNDVIRAYNRGDIDVDDKVIIGNRSQ